jgi:hypothetical protein
VWLEKQSTCFARRSPEFKPQNHHQKKNKNKKTKKHALGKLKGAMAEPIREILGGN